MSQHAGGRVRQELRIDAATDVVWSCFADPARVVGWFPDRAEGELVEGSTLRWWFDRFSFAAEYPVHEVSPGHRARLGVNTAAGKTGQQIEIALNEERKRTHLILTHTGLGSGEVHADEIAGIDSGWALALATLKHYVENYLDQSRRSFLSLQPTTVEYGTLRRWYREIDRLNRWLTRTATMTSAVGRQVELDFQDGGKLTGKLLVDTGRERLLTWNEINGLLTFKGFSTGPDHRMFGFQGTGWGLEPITAMDIETRLTAATERLAGMLAEES